jgi:hypothetical protein
MSKSVTALLVGAIMVVGGLVLYFVFHDVETPVIGLRQAGFVIAVLGVVELAATVWSMIASRD